MSKKLIFILLLAVLLPFAVAAKTLGPNVSQYRGQELKWEDGAYGYHVMFKSLLANKEPETVTDPNRPANPQGDTCKDFSTYLLDQSHIPADAIIEDAYLVWTAAQPIAKKDDITDNEVQLSFVSIDGKISENKTVTGKKAYKVSEAGKVEFEFDGFKDPNDNEKSWYTYRVKIADFFKSIQEKGRAGAIEGSSFYDGFSLLGEYTLSGLECTNDTKYKGSTEMVADWSIILIYSSIEISPKKIYLYDGFNAYWYQSSEITISGFEFPKEPEVRISIASHEGDPGLADAAPEDHEAVREGIEIQGENPVMPGEWLLLSNVCNPPATADKNYQHMEYTEVFNSISSVYGYRDLEPTCIGGIPPQYNNDEIEYGIEVDTFVMDSAAEDRYRSHLQKGDTRLFLKIGANQDQTFTNYMIVSVDTKAPQFDIPLEPEKIACTPANKFDKNAFEGNWCQGTLEHTFALRIQNWGTDEAKSIKVTDTIPSGMEYVPGSTEYATSFKTEKGKKIATRWMKIPDVGGSLPLETGFTLPNPLPNCNDGEDYLSCKDLVMVRFRAKVKNDTAKNQVIENTALYKTPGVNDYKTNLGIPVKLRIASAGCVNSQDAVDLSDCGGEGQAACTKDSDCGGEGYVCDKATGACIDDPSVPKCKNPEITASIGKNSPNSKTIFISNPQQNLVIGQVELAGSGENCYVNLDHARLQITNNDTTNNLSISDIKMYKDENGNGKIDKEDTLIASVEQATSDEALLSAANGRKIYNNKKNYILFALNASYKEGATISTNAKFSAEIEQNGLSLSDGGTITGLPLKFSTFQFEPEEGFIVTTGPHDPEVPAKADINKFQDVLQVRLLSKGSDSTINSITIKTPSKFASLGEGITQLAVFEDTDNDGQGDKELASATTFDSTTQHKFKISLEVKQNEEKFITIKAAPNLDENESFQIILSGLKLNNKLSIYGTPVESKIYENSCDPNLEECGDDDGGCSLTVIDF